MVAGIVFCLAARNRPVLLPFSRGARAPGARESPPRVTDDDRNNPVPSFRRRTCPRSANLRENDAGQHGVPETEGKRAARFEHAADRRAKYFQV